MFATYFEKVCLDPFLNHKGHILFDVVECIEFTRISSSLWRGEKLTQGKRTLGIRIKPHSQSGLKN
jgi:hypothetical protein